MKKQRAILLTSGYYLISFAAYAFGNTQHIPYLTQLGYSPLERSIILSGIAVVGIFLQLFIGFLSDKYRTVKRFVLVGLLLYGVFAFFFYTLEEKVFLYHLLLMALSGGFYILSLDLSDSWTLESEKNVRESYSFIRAFGSIGWALGSFLLAHVIRIWGYSGVGASILLTCIIAIILAFFLKDATKQQLKTQSQTGIQIQDIKRLLSNKKYMFSILVFFLLFSINVISSYAVVDKMLLLGASNQEVGLRWTIQALIEMPIFFFGSYLLTKLKPYKLILIAGVAFIIQFTLFAITNSVSVMIALASMQLFTYPVLLLSAKTLIYDLSNEGLKTTGQMFAFSILNGFSMLVIPIICGIITTTFHVNITILFGVCLGIAALCLLPILIKLPEQKENN